MENEKPLYEIENDLIKEIKFNSFRTKERIENSKRIKDLLQKLNKYFVGFTPEYFKTIFSLNKKEFNESDNKKVLHVLNTCDFLQKVCIGFIVNMETCELKPMTTTEYLFKDR